MIFPQSCEDDDDRLRFRSTRLGAPSQSKGYKQPTVGCQHPLLSSDLVVETRRAPRSDYRNTKETRSVARASVTDSFYVKLDEDGVGDGARVAKS